MRSLVLQVVLSRSSSSEPILPIIAMFYLTVVRRTDTQHSTARLKAERQFMSSDAVANRLEEEVGRHLSLLCAEIQYWYSMLSWTIRERERIRHV